MASRLVRGTVLALALGVGVGCAAMRDDLRRAETAFDQAKYEDVEVWMHTLERDVPHMTREQRTRYYYLRGTTAYRLEDKTTARHFLALCREEAKMDASALRPAWQKEMDRLLAELAPAPEGEADDGAHEKPPALAM